MGMLCKNIAYKDLLFDLFYINKDMNILAKIIDNFDDKGFTQRTERNHNTLQSLTLMDD